MKIIFNILSFIILLSFFSACGGEKEPQEKAQTMNTGGSLRFAALNPASGREDQTAENTLLFLDDLAELERAGSWIQGMALTESGIRENAGDFAGALAAAYKELAWAYGRGLIQKHEVEQGIFNVLSVTSDEIVIIAANAILAFLNENWDEADAGLDYLFGHLAQDEPDGFGRWLLLVCALEKEDVSSAEKRRAGEAYKSIRARYAQFPEYWYRGARAFSGAVAAGYAENCINLSAEKGPFAGECRTILASFTGLKKEDGLWIRTKTEIETIITQSINSGNPQILDSLLPLIGLPDNPYTVYAVGALRALNSVPVYREYFSGQATLAKGRLAERLLYICRG